MSGGVLLVIAAFAGVASGQGGNPPAAACESSAERLRPGLEPPSDEVSRRRDPAQPVDEKITLDLEHLPRRGSPFEATVLLHDIALDEDAPGSVHRGYHGVESVVVRRIMSYYWRLVGDYHARLWNGTAMTFFQLEALSGRLQESEADVARSGNWAQRTWRQSLVPEKGGAPPGLRVETVGREIELLGIGELVLTNEGQLRYPGLAVYFDDDRIYDELSPRLEPLAAVVPRVRELRPARGVDPVYVEGEAPELWREERRIKVAEAVFEDDAEPELERVLKGSLRERVLAMRAGERRVGPLHRSPWAGSGWSLSARPTLQLHLPSSSALEEAVSSAGLEIDLGLFTPASHEPLASVTFKVHGRPNESDTVVALDFEVLTW